MNGQDKTAPTREARKTEKLETLDAHEAAKYLRASFFYSQGDSGLQYLYFLEVSLRRPQLRVASDIDEKGFLLSQLESYWQYLTKGPHTHIDSIPLSKYTPEQQLDIQAVQKEYELETIQHAIILWQIRGHFHELKAFLNNPPPRSAVERAKKVKAVRIAGLVKATVAIEHEILFETSDNGELRPKDRPTAGPNPQHGPLRRNKSQFASFVLSDEPAPGPEVFKEIMTDIREGMKNVDIIRRLDTKTLSKIRDLIDRDRGQKKDKSYLAPYPALAWAIALLPDKI